MTLTEQFQALTFGIEIETTGRTRRAVAEAVRSVVGGSIDHLGGTYDTWAVRATDGRQWKLVRDASVTNGTHYNGEMAEVVSPILRYSDMDTLQEIVRAIRRAGARVDSTCGIHIHIGASAFTVKQVQNLIKLVYKQENILYRALDIEDRGRWAAKIGTRGWAAQELMTKVNSGKVRSMDDLNAAWYGRLNHYPQHYDETRYHGLNLHNIFFRGTIEFRWFAATLHAGKIKAYIQLCLALACKAINAKSASGKERRPLNIATAKYDWRVFLLSLGLIGDEFATARKHLLANLEGDSGFKRGRSQRAAVTERSAEEAAGDAAALGAFAEAMTTAI